MGLLQSRAEMRAASCGWIRKAAVAALTWPGTEAGLSLLETNSSSYSCMEWLLLLQAGAAAAPTLPGEALWWGGAVAQAHLWAVSVLLAAPSSSNPF